ncbi:hypothetical protein ACP275_05G112500 [Erythranthe tilingii]
MTKHRWEGSMKSFENHIDPEKEEQLKSVKTEIESKVKRTLKLAKNINNNKDANMKKKSELIHLVEDFHHHYESLYSMYEDLRGEVKNNVRFEDNASSSSSSSSSPPDSEAYYSPVERIVKNDDNTPDQIYNNQESETSDVEDTTILKDKLTSSSEVKEASTFGSKSQEFNEILEDLTMEEKEEERENTRKKLDRMRDLEATVVDLKIEVETLCTHRRALEEQILFKCNETTQMHEKISRLESRVLEQEENEKDFLSKISEFVEKNKILHLEKGELEEIAKEKCDQVKGLMEQVNSLKIHKSELELELKKKSAEISECVHQIENPTNEDAIEDDGSLKVNKVINDLEIEVRSLSSKNKELEEEIKRINHEAKEQRGKISELKTSLSVKENELSTQQKKHKAIQNDFSAKIELLSENIKNHEKKSEALRKDKDELEKEKREFITSKSQLEKKNTELIKKISDQQKTLLELGEAMSKIKQENEDAQTKILLGSKSNINFVERKVEEMAEEFRKQFEDKYRILSRRIRVAEQLHVENKEWYLKTKDAYEQETKELKERFKDITDMSITANDFLVSLDSLALKFEECNANFMNRISKSSCELKFAKDWARRKNKALVHVKEDLDCLLIQLDDKEGEILVYREKVWKLENKVRELEKVIKEREDGMLGLQEEKREAIRQLCVWIDYHRSRSDYYMKMLSEINPARRKAS